MKVENREWGRPHPVDFVPFLGTAYRLYWMLVARRGSRRSSDEWIGAVWGEGYRLAFSAIFTAGAVVFVLAGGDRTAVRPALLLVLVGVFVHKMAASLGLEP